MAWQTPKTNWQPPDGVRDEDFNRIEGNILELYKDAARVSTTIYVDTAGSDTSGTGTQAAPYATLTKALSTLPKNLNGNTITIEIAAGTYSDSPAIRHFSNGIILLAGFGTVVFNDTFTIENCLCRINALTITARKVVVTNAATLLCFGKLNTTYAGIEVSNCSRAHVYEFTFSGDSSYGAYVTNASSVHLVRGNITNTITYGLYAISGGIITYSELTNKASTPIVTQSGGRVYTGEENAGVNTVTDASVIYTE